MYIWPLLLCVLFDAMACHDAQFESYKDPFQQVNMEQDIGLLEKA